jgi:peptidoglycan glycosyltransferase
LIIRYAALVGLTLAVFGIKKISGHKSVAGEHAALLNFPAKTAPATVPLPVTMAVSTPLEWQSPMRNYPVPDTFSYQGKAMEAKYATDSLLNARINVYLQRYRPETGVILVADLKSGHILAMGERDDSVIAAKPKLAFGSGFPAASLIKILTATAALECNSKYVTDSIPQLGSFHTLYKRQLLVDRPGRQLKITLEDAFAKSVNPAFGLMGLNMGPIALRTQAGRLGFNRQEPLAAIAQSKIEFPDSGFSLAEAACGFTAKTTISPWHALEIARGAGDDGKLRTCIFVRSITDLSSGKEMNLGQDTGEAFLSAANLPKLQALMQATVRIGTARKGFHSILKASHLEKIEAGGKTGSLDGEETLGRFDWFIGYVKLKDQPSRGLAFSIMLVHREYSSVHASQLAALLIRDWLAALEKARKAELSYQAA